MNFEGSQPKPADDSGPPPGNDTRIGQAELRTEKSRQEFKDLFDNAPVGFHEIDAEGRLVRINNTELQMLGYSAGELLGQFVWIISAEEETSRRAVLAKLNGEPPQSNGFEQIGRASCRERV